MTAWLPAVWRALPVGVQDGLSRLLNARFLVGVTGVPFDVSGRVLLYRHTYRRHPWGLPAGWLRRHESLEQCVRREAWEEGRLRIEPVAPCTARVAEGRGHVDVVMLCRFDGGQFTPSLEVSDYGLFAPDALPDELLPAQRPLIAEMAGRWMARPEAGRLPG